MKYKVAELQGALLDAAVAMAEGYMFSLLDDGRGGLVLETPDIAAERSGPDFAPSSVFDDAGPIIWRERISTVSSRGYEEQGGPVFWAAFVGEFSHYIDEPLYSIDSRNYDGSGETPLIAAMRAYVASKFGETVDIPDS
jgi:hypothetical protein